jgi:hypothetical protein
MTDPSPVQRYCWSTGEDHMSDEVDMDRDRAVGWLTSVAPPHAGIF